MSVCESVQERLADEGAALMERDAAIREHVAGCGACGAFLDALRRLDTGLSRLAPLTPPPSLRARTAKAVADHSATPAGRGQQDTSERKLAAALAAMVILAAGFGLTESVQQELDKVQRFYDRQIAASALGDRAQNGPTSEPMVAMTPAPPRAGADSALPRSRMLEAEELSREALQLAERDLDALSQPSNRLPREESASGVASPATHAEGDDRFAARLSKEQKKRDGPLADEARQSLSAGMALGGATTAGSASRNPVTPALAPGLTPGLALGLASTAEVPATHSADLLEYARDAAAAGDAGRADADADAPAAEPVVAPLTEHLAKRLAEPLADDKSNRYNEGARVALLAQPGKAGRLAGAKDKQEAATRTKASAASQAQTTAPSDIARRFLAEQERLTGLSFQPGSGYWANTYIPGDPAIRLLEARLQGWDRYALRARIGDARLEASARQNWQPFDLPRNAALAAYLHADKRAVHGPARLRVQVGLQASQKRSGLRPDMNVGLVLDLRRPLDDASGAKMRALVSALSKARQPGDRFSITVAGHPGGPIIAPQDFRHGPIQVAMQSLFTHTDNGKAPAMDLLAAVASAADSVRQSDDTAAPLGASLVLLVSTAPIAEQREALERMAHENALAGIGLSVVAVGGGADLASIDRLVLLGQGHRRVLAGAEDAVQLVDRELHAASRAVARAVRLRIRLAPGVELIDVLGSKNLSAEAAQRVRDAERSIDQRVARNIGIRADRGDDEEGIQIVIPSFFAGDSHTVLLDVLVPGPGPVAEVSVRYKDLVYRRNGVASARLSIADGQQARGPLEHNVLKNQLAYELARAAADAGRQLGAGDRAGAVNTLTAARDLLIGMRAHLPGWDNDGELRADERLLAQYLQVLGPQVAANGQYQQRLADSLRYLAFRRLVPPHK